MKVGNVDDQKMAQFCGVKAKYEGNSEFAKHTKSKYADGVFDNLFLKAWGVLLSPEEGHRSQDGPPNLHSYDKPIVVASRNCLMWSESISISVTTTATYKTSWIRNLNPDRPK